MDEVYDGMQDGDIKLIRLNITALGLSLTGGVWVVQFCRTSADYGTVIAQRYQSNAGAGEPINIRGNSKHKDWAGWRSVVFNVPPKHFTFPYAPGVEHRSDHMHTYCKDSFGAVHITAGVILPTTPANTWITVGIMPEGARPAYMFSAPCHAVEPGAAGHVEIRTDGTVRIRFPAAITDPGASSASRPHAMIACSYPTAG